MQASRTFTSPHHPCLVRMHVQREMESKRKGGSDYRTLEDLMKPYKKHLLQSAFDLQSRLTQQVANNFLYKFKERSKAKGDEDKRDENYAIDSTTYFFAEFLAWLEVIRSNIVFVTGCVRVCELWGWGRGM
jgi:hypothetical protein